MDQTSGNASEPSEDRGLRSLSREQVLGWRDYWSDDDRAYIRGQIERFSLVSFTTPRVAKYVWCSNAKGERVMKILPGRVEMHVPGEEWHELSKRDDSTPISREDALRWYKHWSADDRAYIETEMDRLGADSFSVPRSQGYVKCWRGDANRILLMVLHPGFVEGYRGFDADHVNVTKGGRAVADIALFGAAWRHELSISGHRATGNRGPARMAEAPASTPPDVVWVTLYYNGDDAEPETLLLGPRELADGDAVEAEIVSPQSPLGMAIVGVAAGETASYTTPSGQVMEVTIVSVAPYDKSRTS